MNYKLYEKSHCMTLLSICNVASEVLLPYSCLRHILHLWCTSCLLSRLFCLSITIATFKVRSENLILRLRSIPLLLHNPMVTCEDCSLFQVHNHCLL